MENKSNFELFAVLCVSSDSKKRSVQFFDSKNDAFSFIDSWTEKVSDSVTLVPYSCSFNLLNR